MTFLAISGLIYLFFKGIKLYGDKREGDGFKKGVESVKQNGCAIRVAEPSSPGVRK